MAGGVETTFEISRSSNYGTATFRAENKTYVKQLTKEREQTRIACW
jgi:hypothetical protein